MMNFTQTLRVVGVAVLLTVVSSATANGQSSSNVKLMRVPDGGIQPQVAVDRQGTVHLIYYKGDPKAGDIYYTRSADGGATFSAAMVVNSRPNSAVAAGNIRGAHLAIGQGGRPHVAWMGSQRAQPRAPGDATPMLYTRLAGGGAFEPQRNVIATNVGLDGGGSIAADQRGHVYVAWHAGPRGGGETARRVWVAASSDDGKTFAPETAPYDEPTGACGCCGMRAFADSGGALYLLYRGARDALSRGMILVVRRPNGGGVKGGALDSWRISACPMSSASMTESAGGVMLAWENNGQIFVSRVNAATGAPSRPANVPGSADRRKHPTVAADDKGQFIVAWTEGMAWAKGGAVAWQVFDRSGRPLPSARGRVDGVPAWSLVAAFARPDGGFTVLY